MENYLFKSSDSNFITAENIASLLKENGADDCDILFVHTALNFGIPNLELKNKQLLARMLEILRELKIPTLCMPTFTFSFCNGKSYNPETSKSKMGGLNEFFRKQEGVVRSLDPLMSVAAEGEKKEILTDIGSHSIGENSTYDIIHHSDGVKFLFLGPRVGECFTYMHYLEWLYAVDYRYTRSFKGALIIDGKEQIKEQDLFVRYNGVTPNDFSFVYEDEMVSKGIAKRSQLGDGFITVVEEKGASKLYKEKLISSPNCFVDIKSEIKDKTFKLEGEMVAL